MLRRRPQGRRYRPLTRWPLPLLFGNGQVAAPAAIMLRLFWRQDVIAQHCSQIVGYVNTVGRRYSRFRPILRIAHKQYQLLAQPRDGKNVRAAFESANFG